MKIISGSNITDVFYKSLEVLQNNYDYYTNDILELAPAIIHVEKPKERCLLIPYRNNNIVQTIAETLWVLGGRNDLAYLKKYLPRADWFSDDGKTWRGGYGTRLRSWFGGVDQLKQVVEVLRSDEGSNRGVMILFDPEKDISLLFKDVPCNNWIQLSIRENKLNMNVTVRANDLIWGFSGINFFEWSVLQEMVANWLEVEVGQYYHFTGFLQLYPRHFERAKLMLKHRIKNDIYTNSEIEQTGVDLSEDNFDTQFLCFFEIEQKFDSETNYLIILEEIGCLESQFLKHCAKIMYSYVLLQKGRYDDFFYVFSTIKEDYYKISAAYNYKRLIPKDKKEIIDMLDKLLLKYEINEKYV
ncbi:thymidylate synthase [Paenibacillus macerans]|uniref:Thymidylate synthase family protein n=1 Tax=Paenibacillus macerans TaxID=44252 RepID=A0A090ZLM5_PAEMA|nr:thymidylate synthase [Paenibacillus macerans]KFN11328.1 thymidylate synthase family protein [Paenibacillus macerans]MCY7560224.1 thymidylate synthase [Paenibacillus macerans]MEC0151278.1 thymidylate synthase [Paenibacillus macerans]SUD26819.1 protein ThyA [Paenibacillus macerans]